MNRFQRFILSFGIAVILTCFLISLPSYSSTTSTNKMTVSDFKSGVEKMVTGNYQGAIPDLTQAIANNSDVGAAYSNRCLAYLQIQDYQNAIAQRSGETPIADCNQALKKAPNNAEAYLNRGLAYYRQGDYSSAIADYNQALSLKVYDFRAYYNRGLANAMLGNYQQAIADYNLALSQISQDPLLLADIYNDRGLAHFDLHNFQAGMLDFSKAIRLNPKDYRAYFNRGCACGKHGDNFGAIDNFSQVIRLNPSNGQAYFNRGVAYHQLGYEQAAIADLQQAAQHFEHQGQKPASEKTLDLIKIVQQEIPSHVETALAF
ncbi:tetratricopeptide repeat protein [Aetokthonos hydrillicola Thurmond2011]|uniref:Tetratricopeptide repeat protein n=1 Tax=Aetokthonos hydrillicola Thurmond2011 TaxID=2712845 RepID=A0AAP5I2Y0_9CYAN|nr:tetratricopeptide repeat protein [Aetokthonos hydrillicola]MBO3457429.1 tetratricopeptide repeat protein [Aetokthonos hydrillicola CCALA 1050]MBW4586049.1 tetratricopeptide repeat protein [Aetokthonos hydrillicola CCALA 1050]MDR9893725.1 tetratricopeptide repeat protein [Aetokthonos hydrillicola Thurmond2011]